MEEGYVPDESGKRPRWKWETSQVLRWEYFKGEMSQAEEGNVPDGTTSDFGPFF